jgi:hypothetical protein
MSKPMFFQEPYIFTNECMKILYGKNIPSYSYYNSNDTIYQFWSDLEKNEIHMIYNYLVKNGHINKTIITEDDFHTNIFHYVLQFCEPQDD